MIIVSLSLFFALSINQSIYDTQIHIHQPPRSAASALLHSLSKVGELFVRDVAGDALVLHRRRHLRGLHQIAQFRVATRAL